MADLVLALATLGAWLLFAAPIYQAGLELRNHDLAVERIRATAESVVPPPPVSSWWWLLPPAKIALEWRRAIGHREAYMNALSVEDFASLLGFMHKATGWALVAMGGLFLAIAQSYAFARQHAMGDVVFVTAVSLLAIACVVGCTMHLRMSERLIARRKRGDSGAGPLRG